MYALRIIALLLTFSLATLSAFARDTWTTYSNGNYVNSAAVQGDFVWCGTTGGVVRWDKRDMSYVKYTTQDGLKDNAVTDVVVGPDDAVWAVTRGGVSFFRDGKWNDFSLPDTYNFLTGGTIAFGDDGSIWVGGYYSLVRFKDGGWTSFDLTDILPHDYSVSFDVSSIAFFSDGSVWVGTTYGLNVYRNDIWEHIANPDGVLASAIWNMAVTSDGAVWTGGLGGVYRFLDGEWKSFTEEDGLKVWIIEALGIDGNGAVWVSGVNVGGMGGGPYEGGVYRFNGSVWEEIAYSEGADIIRYSCAAFDRDGTAWFGAYEGGLWWFEGGQWTNYLTDDRITDSHISSLAVESDGSVWLGMDHVFNRYDGFSWGTYDIFGTPVPFNWNESMISYGPVQSIAVTPGGDTWFAAWSRVILHHGETWTVFDRKNGLPSETIQSVAVRSEKDIWFGAQTGIVRFDGVSWTALTATENGDSLAGPVAAGPSGEVWTRSPGKGVARFANDRWMVFSMNEGLADSVVTYIAAAPDGTAWFAGQNRLSRYDGAQWTSYAKEVCFPGATIICMAAAPDGAVWLGTYDSGVFRFDGNAVWRHTTADGLADNQVESIAFAPDGAVWLGTSSGLSRFVPGTWTAATEIHTRPEGFFITGNHPNPFNPSTIISFTVPRSGYAELVIYSITGQKIRTLVSGFTPAGTYSIRWDGKDEAGKPVSSGVYLARLRAGELISGHRMLLMK